MYVYCFILLWCLRWFIRMLPSTNTLNHTHTHKKKLFGWTRFNHLHMMKTCYPNSSTSCRMNTIESSNLDTSKFSWIYMFPSCGITVHDWIKFSQRVSFSAKYTVAFLYMLGVGNQKMVLVTSMAFPYSFIFIQLEHLLAGPQPKHILNTSPR